MKREANFTDDSIEFASRKRNKCWKCKTIKIFRFLLFHSNCFAPFICRQHCFLENDNSIQRALCLFKLAKSKEEEKKNWIKMKDNNQILYQHQFDKFLTKHIFHSVFSKSSLTHVVCKQMSEWASIHTVICRLHVPSVCADGNKDIVEATTPQWKSTLIFHFHTPHGFGGVQITCTHAIRTALTFCVVVVVATTLFL